ncbi:hypothetical protein E4U41_006014 [Claviceps citrina]|nr:hypothetical protein E4U41_006014 [Claviceps citrina]
MLGDAMRQHDYDWRYKFRTAGRAGRHEDEDAAVQTARIGEKTEQLLIDHGLPKPSLGNVKALYAVYKEAYRNNRRAAPGAIQAMARLRENGYQIASMSAHGLEQHEEMATVAGFRHLIDHIVRLDIASRSAQDGEMLDQIIRQLKHPVHLVLVRHISLASKLGTSSTNSGMRIIVYSSLTRNSESWRPDSRPTTIHRLDQLLHHVGIKTRCFTPTMSCHRGQVVLEGLGMDLVTEPCADYHMSKKTAKSLVQKMGTVLLHISQRLHIIALTELGEMMRLLASTDAPSGAAEIRIFAPGHDQAKSLKESTHCLVVEKRYSIVVELGRLTLDIDSHTEPIIRATANYLQLHCNDLMREHPRQAIRRLRSATITIAEAAGIREYLSILGENIEPWIGSKARSGSGGRQK